jgi:hypothetical protein
MKKFGVGGKGSSLLIVPMPWPSAMVALAGLLRLTKKLSFCSKSVSPFTVTLICFEVSPGLKVTTPFVA